jgi:hypothetical protein
MYILRKTDFFVPVNAEYRHQWLTGDCSGHSAAYFSYRCAQTFHEECTALTQAKGVLYGDEFLSLLPAKDIHISFY